MVLQWSLCMCVPSWESLLWVALKVNFWGIFIMLGKLNYYTYKFCRDVVSDFQRMPVNDFPSQWTDWKWSKLPHKLECEAIYNDWFFRLLNNCQSCIFVNLLGVTSLCFLLLLVCLVLMEKCGKRKKTCIHSLTYDNEGFIVENKKLMWYGRDRDGIQWVKL